MALSKKQMTIAKLKPPFDEITSDDLAALRKTKETAEEMQKGGRVVLKPLMRKRG